MNQPDLPQITMNGMYMILWARNGEGWREKSGISFFKHQFGAYVQ